MITIKMNTYDIICALATMKIVPVHNHNFVKFSPWSLSSFFTFLVLFFFPAAFFVFGEITAALETSSFPEVAKTPLTATAYFLTSTNMFVILLAGPQLLGILLKSCDSLFDIRLLPTPKMHWLIWLSAPVPFLACLPSGIIYSDELREIPAISWAVVNIYSSVPLLLTSLLYGVMQACIIFIMESILVYLLNSFKELLSPNADVDKLIDICDTYDTICKVISPLYMILFATSSTSLLMMSFVLYYYASQDFSTVVFSVSWLVLGGLLLYHLSSEATDCEDMVNQLLIHFRLF
jgi:hypothetical protein